MIEISKKIIDKFHNSIDDYSSFEKCWNISNPDQYFHYKENGKYKYILFKNFSYLIYCSCEPLKNRGRVAQMCDNTLCCNPFHLHPYLSPELKESKIFEDMLSRMRNPHNPFYKDYGGRGLDLDDRWNPDLHLHGVARINFYHDIHELGFQPNLSIDRIDNNKGYLKDNIRFVDWKVQGQNRRTTKLTPDIVKYIRENYYIKDHKSNAIELAKKFGISPSYLKSIIDKKNWKNIE